MTSTMSSPTPPTSPPPILVVTYRMRSWDLVVLNCWAMLRIMTGLYVVVMALDTVIRILSRDVRPWDERLIEYVVFAVALALAFAVIGIAAGCLIALTRRRFTRITSTVTLLEHALRDESAHVLHEFQWPAISQIHRVAGRIMIVTNIGLAIIIPNNAFETDSSASSFFFELERRWKVSHQSG